MWDVIRDSTIGQLLRCTPARRNLAYVEEADDFELATEGPMFGHDQERETSSPSTDREKDGHYKPDSRSRPNASSVNADTAPPTISMGNYSTGSSKNPAEGTVLVQWYDEDDQSNPRNWSNGKKGVVTCLICTYTFCVYIGSSIYVADIPEVMKIFHVGPEVAILGLSLFVLATGIGPMLWSPLSEIPWIGRNIIYIATFTTYAILCIAAALVNNLAGFLVLRFLLGFFGSPVLATGGASLADIYSPFKVPYAIAIWAAAATVGPALGPTISSFAVQAEGWRWSSWELLLLSGPTLAAMFVFLPETSADAILVQRARRLRRIPRFGTMNFKTRSEITQASMTSRQVAIDALIKPLEINIKDPAVLFTTCYTALVYGIFYSFFESFPLVYTQTYGLNLGETGLTYLAVAVTIVIVVPCYCAWVYFIAEPAMRTQPGYGSPEARLLPAVFAAFLVPIGLFIYAWTSRRPISLYVSLAGVTITMCGVFVVMQSMLLYLPFVYPQYAASLFAANDFVRVSFAFGSMMFSRPMFITLGVDGGVSLLAGLAVVCIGGTFLLYFYGARLRKRSKFAVSPNG